MKVEPAAPHVPYVFGHLWERGVEELAGLGLTPEQGAAKALEFCQRGDNQALLFDNPVCVFGVVDGCTWFQATDEFLKHHREITAHLRNELSKRDCVIYSQCVHPLTARWFKSLGFVRDEWEGKTDLGKAVYRFRRTDNVL